MKHISLILAAALSFAVPCAKAVDSLTTNDFAHAIKLQVNGYTGTETLENFPVLVRISESGIPGFLYSDLSTSSGKDIAFFDEAGNHLASEIQTNSWKSTDNESQAWVLLPEMTRGTKFYMCYNTSASGVWVTNANPWVEYVGVWHLDEAGGKSKPVFDSTTNGLNGVTSAKGSPAVYASGKVGKARRIATDTSNNPGYDSGITVAITNDAAKLGVVNDLTPEFTASFWYLPAVSKANYEYLLSRKSVDGYNAWGLQFGMESTSSVSPWNQIRVWGGNSGNYAVGSGATFGTGDQYGMYIPESDTTTWRKMDCVWTSDKKYSLYVDGVLVAAGALSGNKNAVNGSLNLSIGGALAPASGKGGRGFNGYMDEVRVRVGTRSADWIKADYDTVNNASFVIVAPADVLTVEWANAEGAAPGVSETAYNSVAFGGTVQNLGEAASCDVEYKVWEDGAGEPVGWTTLTNGLVAADAFEVVVEGLESSTTYNYKLQAVGSDHVETNAVAGTFTTGTGVCVEWSSASGTTGFQTIAYDFVKIGGTVTALGEASSCIVQRKVWVAGESEPADWTTFATGLVLDDSFTDLITDLTAGTTYNYKLRAYGNDDASSEVVEGSFTTLGEAGETIGSPETHFFDDGTNAYWVANEFERYLGFTVTGYTGTETLTNFPVLVDVRKNDTNGFTYDDFYHAGGRDIVFVDEKGHIIPHEIDTWNPNGMSLIWVRLPEMNNGTKFTMCYRSPLVNPPADPGNAFEKYVGVWHMNEKADGIVDVIDSTTNNLVGETHANSLASNNGRIGGCRRVAQQSGTSSTYGHIIVTDHDDILRTGVGNVFTYSCWSKLADNKPGWAYLVSRKREDADRGWGIQYHDESESAKKIRIWSGNTSGNKNDCTLLDITNYTHTSWACWTFVYDNTNCTAYLDGVKLKTVVLEGRNTHTIWPVANDETATYDGLVIGGQEIGTGALNGWVDECRYSKGIRSADWIKAEYDSTMQQANWENPTKRFVTKGEQVGRGEDTLVPVVVWEQGEGMPNTIVDVSYAYVQFAGTVTYCGAGADMCWIEYQIWADGATMPTEWSTLLADATPGTAFSIPVFGLKQDMPYNFRIRVVNEVDGERRQTREIAGAFRTNGNVNESADAGELLRVDNKFVHMYRAGQYTFTTPDYVTNISIIVVGGGGAGGYKIGGGGGGGGVFYSQSYAVTTSTTYRITVGHGGTAPTNITTASSAGCGEYSAFALDADPSHPLIRVPGGGGGGSLSTTESIVNGSEGASGGGAGGKGDNTSTGASGGAVTSVDGVSYGHKGGDGNHKNGSSGSAGTYAAGGGGGGRSAGLAASSDKYYGGGAGGSGVACDMLGEKLYFGAGGGGGYVYFEDASGSSKPGAGGGGIGGNAADIKTGTLATSGVENTGAGGGGGSMRKNSNNDREYWQGGDGGDGVVIISYEVHGRDPIAEEPRIAMTSCTYVESVSEEEGEDTAGIARIAYRVYWAGVQNDTADIYVHYSTVGIDDLTNNVAGGGWVKIAESVVGVGSGVFIPPEVGYTYWVHVVARKNANSYAFSDEIASFKVPAITLNGATWSESKTSPAEDCATVSYKLYDTNEVTHLYCYWSETRGALEGDAAPSGDGVFLLDLGPNTGTNLSSATTFDLTATEGLARNRTYYIRLACGDAQGIKHFLSDDIVVLDTAETPITVLTSATWADSNVATVDFKATVGKLDPAQTELVVLYSGVQGDVKSNKPETKASVTVASLGFCSELALDEASPSTTFPLWSEVATNYFVRLALATNFVTVVDGVATTNRVIVSGSYSIATKAISVFHAIEANTLLYIVAANPKVMCYGDSPLSLDYVLEYAGQTDGWGWTNKYGLTGALVCHESTNPPPVAVSSTSPSGNYPITQGSLLLEDGGATKNHYDDVTGTNYNYQYKLTFSGATYTITNAVFSTAISDVVTNYTGEACGADALVCTTNGVRNGQPVTYLYRVGGAGAWGVMPSITDVGNYTVQFKATAPNHDDVRGSFKLTIEPAPLAATIAAPSRSYTGEPVVPAVVTNVTGLVRPDLNALTCSFRDEAGEWQSTVPTFTTPGTYKLFFRVSAPNHTTYVTNCTVTITPWDFKVNMDGATGYNTPIVMGRPEWLISNSGKTGEYLSNDEARYEALDAICPNGLRLWQNYVLERTDFGKKAVATIMQQGSTVSPNAFVVHFPDIEPLMSAGLRVQYRLDRKLRGERSKSEFDAAAFDIGEPTGKYELNIPLDQDDPTGLYVFNIVFSPTNELYTGQSVISSVTTVGVMRVSSALTNVVTVAPWLSMSVDSTNEIEVAVADVVNPNSIGAQDSIRAYDNTSEPVTYREWNRREDGDWDAPRTVTTRGVSQSAAETASFAPGKAFWFVRKTPGPYIYLIGRYTGEDYFFDLEGGSAEERGATLVANPTFFDVDLNDLVFVDDAGNTASPAADDRISFLDIAGMWTTYARSSTNTWGRNVRTKVGNRIKQVWTEDGTVPSGTGFWYYRSTDEGALRIKFETSR